MMLWWSLTGLPQTKVKRNEAEWYEIVIYLLYTNSVIINKIKWWYGDL